MSSHTDRAAALAALPAELAADVELTRLTAQALTTSIHGHDVMAAATLVTAFLARQSDAEPA
jgi:hypothetical protein